MAYFRLSIVLFLCISVRLMPSNAFAEQLSIVDAFEQARREYDYEQPEDRSLISYNLNGCILERVIVNPNYCEKFGEGDRSRTITSLISLDEVVEINAKEHRGDFMLVFDFEYEKPGRWSHIQDIFSNGFKGFYERAFIRGLEAIENISLKSGIISTKCDGTYWPKESSTHAALIFERPPEGWRRVVQVARKCRGSRDFTFADEYGR